MKKRGAEEREGSVLKHLPPKCQGLNLTHCMRVKMVGMVVHTCKCSAGEIEAGSGGPLLSLFNLIS